MLSALPVWGLFIMMPLFVSVESGKSSFGLHDVAGHGGIRGVFSEPDHLARAHYGDLDRLTPKDSIIYSPNTITTQLNTTQIL